jgi:hypothetical protein
MTPMDDGDYTYDCAPTMDERIAAAQAKMAQNLASVDTMPFDQRVTAKLAKLEAKIDQRDERDKEIYGTLGKLEAAVDVLTLQVHRLSERQNHADAWLHKLLNPDDNPPMTAVAPSQAHLDAFHLFERVEVLESTLARLLGSVPPPVSFHTVWTGTTSAGQFSGDHEDGV